MYLAAAMPQLVCRQLNDANALRRRTTEESTARSSNSKPCRSALPGDNGSTGSRRSKAWIAVFSSTQNTAACCGGFMYSPNQEEKYPDKHRTAPYVGSRYCEGKRILFIGMDRGKSEDSDADVSVSKRQEGVVAYYLEMNKKWNLHYRGCVWVAADYLHSACSSTCEVMCKRKSESECVLFQFSQTNAQQDVQRDTPDMASQSTFDVTRESLLKQLELFDPDLIVVQSRSKLAEPLRQSMEGLGEWQDVPGQELLKKIVWSKPDRSASHIALFVHPSALGKFQFRTLWSSEILPVLDSLKDKDPEEGCKPNA